MNYLGHAYLSFGDADILTGNMIGDHVKGKLVAQQQYPEAIWNGVMLHRKIDEFSDNHPATKRTKILFREDYGLYAGAIMDTLYDHFIANDPKLFKSYPVLEQFTLDTYAKLEQNAAYFPAGFAAYFASMKEHNWLYNYRIMKGMERALGGLFRRAQQMPSPEKAYRIFVTHFYEINQAYYEIIDDIIPFVKNELGK